MPIKRKKGESEEDCMRRAMKENLKNHPYKEALAISLKQCGVSDADAFTIKVSYNREDEPVIKIYKNTDHLFMKMIENNRKKRGK